MFFRRALMALCVPCSLLAMDWGDPALLAKNNAPIKEKIEDDLLYSVTLYHGLDDLVHVDATDVHTIVKIFSSKGYCDHLSIDVIRRKIDFVRLKITTNTQIGPDIDLYDNAERVFSRVLPFPLGYEYLVARKHPSKLVALFINLPHTPAQRNRNT